MQKSSGRNSQLFAMEVRESVASSVRTLGDQAIPRIMTTQPTTVDAVATDLIVSNVLGRSKGLSRFSHLGFSWQSRSQGYDKIRASLGEAWRTFRRIPRLQTMAWLLMVDPHHVEEFSTVSVLTLTTPLTCSTIVAWIIPGVTH